MKTFVTSICFLLMSCATTHPEKIPEIDGRILPPLKLSTLEPRDLEVVVINERKVNQEAGNSKDIENFILGQISQSLAQGGIRLYPPSENKITFRLQDCSETGEEAECLTIRTEFVGAKLKHHFENKCVDQIQNKVTKNFSRGDVNRVYQDCLKRQFEALNRTFSPGHHLGGT